MSKMKRKLAVFGICLLCFTAYLDATIVSTALPDIQVSLHMSLSSLQWIMNAFFVGLSAFMASMGSIGDILGRRKVFYTSVAMFMLASIGAGFATSAGFLIFCRALQGISTAGSLIVGLSLISNITPPEEHGKAFGTFGAVTGLGLALGPLIGGVLVSWFSWPAIFFINIPFAIIGFAFCLSTVPESRVENNNLKIDYLGIIFLTITISSLVYGFVQASSAGWVAHSTLISFLVTVVALAALVITERRVTSPILPGYLFKENAFTSCLLLSLAGGGMMAVVLFVNPLYLHTILQQSFFMTGVYITIIAVCVIIAAKIFGPLSEKVGCKAVLICSAIFYVISGLLYLAFPASLHLPLVIITFVIFGLGWGIFNSTSSPALTKTLSADHLGVGLGALYTFWNVGSAVVLAISLSLFHQKAWHAIKSTSQANNISLTEQNIQAIKLFISHPDKLSQVASNLTQLPDAKQSLTNAFVSGMHIMFWPCLILGVLAALSLIFRMKKIN